MTSHRVLLFGGSGQVGQALRHRQLPASWELLAPTRAECNLMEPGEIGNTIQKFKPDLVINSAAMTDIDACENDRPRATEINFHAVANIAGQCDTVNAPLMQISTDYVFDGKDGERPYETDAPMNPVNVYGQTKMLGEEAVRHGLYWHVIMRTSLVFSAFGENILVKTLQQIDTKDEIQAVIDQKANPTSAESVCDALIMMGDAILRGKGNGFGTFHICGEPPVTRFEFLQAIMNAYAPFTERRPKLVSVSSAQLPGRVPRPPCSILDCSKAREVYGIEPSRWREDLARAVKQYAEAKTA